MRNLLSLPAIVLIALAACTSNSNDREIAQSTQDSESSNWITLFDGTNTDQWRSYNSDSFPSGWSIENDILVFESAKRDGAEGRLHLMTKDKYENFHLRIEWKIETRSNSGIFYGVLEQEGIDIHWSGLEYQILDPDYFPEINDDTKNRITGALYDLVEPQPQNVNPVGEWNSTEIIVDGSTVIHRLNGETIVEVERWTPEWFEMVRNSKFASHNEFGNIREGHIGIQDHGGKMMLRNIKIKKL